MKLSEIEERQAAIRAELDALDGNPDATEEDYGDLRDTLIAEHETLDQRKAPIVERMEKLSLIRRNAQNNGNREPADPGNGDGGGSAEPNDRTWAHTPEFMTRHDPFAELDKVRRGLIAPKEMISRAELVIEMHNKRGLLSQDRAEECVRKNQFIPGVARHMLLTGTDRYVEAFRAYLNDPTGEGLHEAQRALTMGTASGGYLLPYVLDPTIVITNAGSTNPYRRIAEVKTTVSNAWQGVNSAGVNMGWLDEAAAATADTSTIGQIQIYPKKAAAWVLGSFEFMGDTNFADQLPRLLADAKDILEETAFAVGTGGALNAGQPYGLASRLGTAQAVASVLGTALAAFPPGSASAVGNVYALNAALPPRFRLSAAVAWLANITNINAIRALDQYGGGSFWANLGAGQPERLLDKPIAESPSITAGTAIGTAIANAPLFFGDFSKFYIVDRIGSTMLFDPLVKAAATPNVPSGQQGWFYYWRVGSDVATANAFRYLRNG